MYLSCKNWLVETFLSFSSILIEQYSTHSVETWREVKSKKKSNTYFQTAEGVGIQQGKTTLLHPFKTTLPSLPVGSTSGNKDWRPRISAKTFVLRFFRLGNVTYTNIIYVIHIIFVCCVCTLKVSIRLVASNKTAFGFTSENLDVRSHYLFTYSSSVIENRK